MKIKSDGARRLLAGGIIATAAALAYSNSGSGAFVFDDRYSIVDNDRIRHLWPISPVLAPGGGGLTVNGRPLVNLSLAINRVLGGLNPWGYHLFNLVIHILAGLVLFGIVRRTYSRWRDLNPPLGPGVPWILALSVAVLWTLHPLQTESVTYIVQRAESMMGLFYLVTVYCFIRLAEDESLAASATFWPVLSVAACFLGMACKEVMVSAPVMVWFYDRTFFAGTFGEAWRRRRRYYAALALTWVPLAGLVIAAGNRGDTTGLGIGVSAGAFWLRQFSALVRYLELVFWPHPLIFDYGTAWAPFLWPVEPAAAVVLLLAGATAYLIWRRPRLRHLGDGGAVGFMGVWFFAILAPTSLVPANRQLMAEHRMYLALAPVLVLAVIGLQRILRRHRLAFGVILAGWAVALGLTTYGRNRDYASELTLYCDTVAKLPNNIFMQSGLGYALVSAGRAAEAEGHYREALRLAPGYAEAHLGLADTLANVPGREADAISEFAAALRLDPKYFQAHLDLANALAAMPGRRAEAIVQYEEALALRPRNADAHNNFAVALAAYPSRRPDALAQYEEALRLRPGSAEFHTNLANTLAQMPGRAAEAIAQYREALRLDPHYFLAHYNLAVLYVHSGRRDDAIYQLQRVLEFDPDNRAAREGLARLQARP